MAQAFVIHLHTGHGPDHYDLMFETGAALATWRLAAEPASLSVGEPLPAIRLADHRRAYLTYEGPVSRGRGRVRRVDAGDYELLARDETAWTVRLAGSACRGTFVLRRAQAAGDDWLLTRMRDED